MRRWKSGALKPWERLKSEPVSDHRIFRLRTDVSRSPRTGREHPFVVLEGTDWVNVIPVTADGKVVMVEQFRHGVREFTLEVPGGMVDPGEEPAAAAVREMREESGYDGTAELLGWIHPNPAVQENRCWSYLVRGAKKVGEAHAEPTEDIAVHEVPLPEIPALVQDGSIRHALVVVAFTWLWLKDGFPAPARR